MEEYHSTTRLRSEKSAKSENVTNQKFNQLKNSKTVEKKQVSIDTLVCVIIILVSAIIILDRSKIIPTEFLIIYKVSILPASIYEYL